MSLIYRSTDVKAVRDMCPPEAVSGNKASTELKGFVQRARHLLAGLLIRAHVLYAGQQLVQALPEEHLGL